MEQEFLVLERERPIARNVNVFMRHIFRSSYIFFIKAIFVTTSVKYPDSLGIQAIFVNKLILFRYVKYFKINYLWYLSNECQ